MIRHLSILSVLPLLGLAACSSAPTLSAQSTAKPVAGSQCETATVKGMTCEMCAQAVTGTLKNQSGVTGVVVDVPNGKVRVTTSGPALPQSTLKSAIERSGYTLVSVTPGC